MIFLLLSLLSTNAEAAAARKVDAGIVEFKQQATPANPAAGFNRIYSKVDGLPYWLNSAGVEQGIALGTPSPLTTKGDLYTYSTTAARLPVGTDGFLLTADSAEVTGLKWAAAPTSGINQLTGDVTAGPGSGSQAATVVTVGGETAADIATSVTDTQAATTANTPSTIVKRDGSGNFSAGTITAALSGNASTATSLAANPTDCAAGSKAVSIDASGNLTCSAVSLTADVSGTLPVANGGTGASTLSANAVIIGNGTSPVQFITAGTSGNVLTSNGTNWTSAAPASTGGRAAEVDRTADFTFTSIGTPSGAEVFVSKDGKWVYIRGHVTCGTSAATDFQLNLPADLEIDTTGLDTDLTVFDGGLYQMSAGSLFSGNAVHVPFFTGNDNFLKFSRFTGSGVFDASDGNAVCSSGQKISFRAQYYGQ